MFSTSIYHFVYVTTCALTGSYYIGVHSTKNLHDGYLGSGKRLGYSIRKYGRENHKLEILEFLSSREDANLLESKLVTWDLINSDKSCMNLAPGGKGGDKISNHPNRQEILSKKTYEWMRSPEYRQAMSEALKPKSIERLLELQERQKQMVQLKKASGYKHSVETKKKISANNKAGTESVRAKIRNANLGKKNPAHGEQMKEKFKQLENHPRTLHLTLTSPSNEIFEFIGREEFYSFCISRGLSGGKLIRAKGAKVQPPKRATRSSGMATADWCLVEKRIMS